MGLYVCLSLQEWMCEFCGSKNEVDVVPEELPTEEDTTYMIAPAPLVGGGAGGAAGTEDSLVIFCIDISGSMCVTTEVGGAGHSLVQQQHYIHYNCMYPTPINQ